jgi:hypothetical protein
MGKLIRRGAWAAGALAALLVGASGCSGETAVINQPTATQPAATATTTPAARLTPVSGLLDPAPAVCPTTLPPGSYTLPKDFGGGFVGGGDVKGSSPVWELGLGTPLTLNAYGATPYPVTKVMWLVGPNYSNPVTLQGQDITDATPAWFDLTGAGPGNATTTAVLDPNHPNRGGTDNSTGHWNIWGVEIYFQSAGCYKLTATWPEGRWSTTIAVGR